MNQRVVIGGASGLIGEALVDSLRADGIDVTRLVRHEPAGPDEVRWLDGDELDPQVLAGAVAVVGLNGSSIGKFPWTHKYKETLRTSRLEPTQQLAAAVRRLGKTAPLFVSASAVGYYGLKSDEPLDEQAPAGSSFLAQLCAEWEAAALSAGEDARVALLRTAPVVHEDGVLSPMILLTKFGVSGPIAGGEQKWPWIALEDEVRAIRHIIDKQLTGPFNLTGPRIATANQLGRALAREYRRPFAIPAPEWGMKLVLGDDATESLLTTDVEVLPTALLASGFEFRYPTVQDAVVAGIGK